MCPFIPLRTLPHAGGELGEAVNAEHLPPALQGTGVCPRGDRGCGPTRDGEERGRCAFSHGTETLRQFSTSMAENSHHI